MVKKPPIGGPAIGPTRAGMVSQAMADTSWLFGVVRIRTSREIGDIMAPPMPWKKRAPTKAGRELEKAQASEPSMKTTMAQRKTFFAPNRSAIHPLTGMKMASDTR